MRSAEYIDLGDREISFEEAFAIFGTGDVPKILPRKKRERETTPDVYSFIQNNQNMDRRMCR